MFYRMVTPSDPEKSISGEMRSKKKGGGENAPSSLSTHTPHLPSKKKGGWEHKRTFLLRKNNDLYGAQMHSEVSRISFSLEILKNKII